jgi:uncharacterized protein with von Willebrand factor type A (vWA) domain
MSGNEMSGKDYLEKVEGESTLLERIMRYIPGYRGYKEKELRRESDRLVRAEAVSRLRAAKNPIRMAMANPEQVEKLDQGDAYRMDAFNYRLDRITERVDKAIAGYAGMFDAVKVKEDKLDSVLQYDVGLIEKAEEIRAGAEQVAKMQLGNEDWETAIDQLTTKVEEYDTFIDKRSGILRALAV